MGGYYLPRIRMAQALLNINTEKSMIKGLYRSASAMLPRIKQQETIANNLANVSTPGFKKDQVFTRELTRAQASRAPRQNDWETPMIDQVYTRYTQGNLDKTGNPLDLAIEGDGFFVMENESGAAIYSRTGNFQVDAAGFLTTSEGYRLMGDGGPINVEGGNVAVSETGQVEVNNDVIGNIQVVTVDDKTQLAKVGQTGFVLPDGVAATPAVNVTIKQGYIEISNVNVVKEMVEMIISYRNYEADAKALKAQDESLDNLFNQVGRVR